VTGFIGTYFFQPNDRLSASLLDDYNVVDTVHGGGFGFNSPDLPTGDVAILGFDTAWSLTSAHGNPKVGFASIDYIDVAYTLANSGVSPVPEPSAFSLAAVALMGALAFRCRR
jgi:hypothetical protein